MTPTPKALRLFIPITGTSLSLPSTQRAGKWSTLVTVLHLDASHESVIGERGVFAIRDDKPTWRCLQSSLWNIPSRTLHLNHAHYRQRRHRQCLARHKEHRRVYPQRGLGIGTAREGAGHYRPIGQQSALKRDVCREHCGRK